MSEPTSSATLGYTAPGNIAGHAAGPPVRPRQNIHSWPHQYPPRRQLASTMDMSDPLLSTSCDVMSVLVSEVGPPSPPWEDEELLLEFKLDGPVESEANNMDEFLSLSPSSLRLDSETDEAINSFLQEDSGLSLAQVKDIFCEQCHGHFSTLDKLEKHDCCSVFDDDDLFKSLMDAEVELEDDMSSASSPDDSRSTSLLNHCDVCKLVFSNPKKLDIHRQNFAEKIRCCHCSKTFATLSKLRIHHRKHSKEKPFQCLCCGKYYTHRNTLLRHQQLYCFQKKSDKSPRSEAARGSGCRSSASAGRTSVEGQKSTRCPVCLGEFFDTESLSNHTDYHLKHRTCCSCQKQLASKSKLQIHHRSHTKELPYSCSLCDKSFAEKSTLRKHVATHGERNFRCEICSKAFVRKDYLVKHALTHRQTYKCSQCSFVCHSAADIQAHVSHTHAIS